MNVPCFCKYDVYVVAQTSQIANNYAQPMFTKAIEMRSPVLKEVCSP